MKTSFGGKIMKENPKASEIVFIGKNNECRINGAPKNVDSFGIIGWVTLSGKDNWYKVVFENKTFISPIGKTGDKLYVIYFIGERNMNKDYTFEILEVTQEKRLDGRTKIKAKCLEDGNDTLITIEINNILSCKREYIKEKLIAKYEEISKENPSTLQVGEFL